MKLCSHQVDTIDDLIRFLKLLPRDTPVRMPEKYEPMTNLAEGDYDDYAGMENGNLLMIQLSYFDGTLHVDKAP